MIKKIDIHKFIYLLLFIFVLFALVNTVVFAKPPLPPGAGQPGEPGGPGGPDQPGLSQPNQPDLPGQPKLPPCPECGNGEPTTAPTTAPTTGPQSQPTQPPVAGPGPTSTPGPGPTSTPGPGEPGPSGGTPGGQVLGLAATSAAPYNILVEGVLGLSLVCFALALKGQANPSLKRKE